MPAWLLVTQQSCMQVWQGEGKRTVVPNNRRRQLLAEEHAAWLS